MVQLSLYFGVLFPFVDPSRDVGPCTFETAIRARGPTASLHRCHAAGDSQAFTAESCRELPHVFACCRELPHLCELLHVQFCLAHTAAAGDAANAEGRVEE